jgi:pyruvate/2-oxoglutarate/acetoin dehydrogenase E1 component
MCQRLLYFAIRKGCFKKEGNEVTIIALSSGALALILYQNSEISADLLDLRTLQPLILKLFLNP